MDQYLGKFSGFLYAAFRIVSGLLFAQHGAQKLFAWLGGMGEDGGSAPFLSLMFFAGLVEFFGGLLIAVGFNASWAAFIASGEMAVAYFMSHFPKSFWPLENEGEPAVLFCFIFLYMATQGSGIWGVDAARGGARV